MRAALVAIALAAVCGCGKSKAPAKAAPPLRTATDSAAADAAVLGQVIYHLLDLAADFRGSHRGRLPRALSDLAIDSLTPTVARGISATPDFSASATFRRPEGHAWVSCQGGLKVLEDAVLGSGRYTLTCVGPDGVPQEVVVGGDAS